MIVIVVHKTGSVFANFLLSLSCRFWVHELSSDDEDDDYIDTPSDL